MMQVEVALALLQNVAYSSDGVACILNEGGVSLVLRAMRQFAHVAEVGKNGLGVLWNLCDSDDHWSAFLQEGPAMVAVLLTTMQQHPSNKAIEESVIDMLWDVSSTSDGQAHIVTEGGVPLILRVMRVHVANACVAMRPSMGNRGSVLMRHDGSEASDRVQSLPRTGPRGAG